MQRAWRKWVCLLLIAKISSVLMEGHSSENIRLHSHMTRDELEHFFGVSLPEEVPQYDVIVPYLSDEQGLFHGYNVQTRRASPSRRLYYMIPLSDSSLLLSVTPINQSDSQEIAIETHHSDGTVAKDTTMMTVLVGHVMSYPGSSVAISNAKGLDGIIKTDQHSIYIRPLSPRLARVIGNRRGIPHVVTWNKKNDMTYKRDSLRYKDERITKRTKHKYLEMAIVADNYAIESIGIGEKNRLYHLTMLSVLANSMFYDESIGEQKIALILIKIILKLDGLGYEKKVSNREKLNVLSGWVKKAFPEKDEDGRHPDVVVLVTKGQKGGLANVASTCLSGIGTAVANDAGFATAQIMVHEIAHTLGVGHDAAGNKCADGRHIMSTVITGGKDPLRWSICSKTQIQTFLSGPESSCLDDKPGQTVHEPDEFKIKLPGQVYDGDTQCKKIYGEKYYQCKKLLQNCGSLYCAKSEGGCSTTLAPPLDGTRCGERHWCIKGECIDDGTSMVHGGWSDWLYTTCTHTCGGGVQWKQRKCTNPTPRGGGMKCEGPEKLTSSYQICNAQKCPIGGKSSRDLQCENKNLHGSRSVVDKNDPCTLKCRRGALLYSEGTVTDGTRCSDDPEVHDVCIQGKCRNVGCDNVLESGVKVDRCGHCNGDGTKCGLHSGTYNKNYKGWGISNADVIVTAPIGATHIYVHEDSADRNRIGIQYGNGKYVIPVSTYTTTRKTAGTTIKYHHEHNEKEWFYIAGPITQPLSFVFIYFGLSNKGVHYRYYGPGKSEITADQVEWQVSVWGACSKKCAVGEQKRTVECRRKDDNTYINDKVCERKSKKLEKIRSCSTLPCSPEWFVSGWTKCSKTCGKGMQTRHVVCRERTSELHYRTIDDSRCHGNKPSPLSKPCNYIACEPEWFPLKWGKCSKTCAGGITTRELVCRRVNEHGFYMTLVPHMCRHAPRTPTQEPCNSDVLCPVSPPNGGGKTPPYRALGCYRDKYPHAVPVFLGSLRGQIKWTNMKSTVDACARLVKQRNPTYKVFGVKFYGECWSGPAALQTYDRYGSSSSKSCYSGVGTHYTYYVYQYM